MYACYRTRILLNPITTRFLPGSRLEMNSSKLGLGLCDNSHTQAARSANPHHFLQDIAYYPCPNRRGDDCIEYEYGINASESQVKNRSLQLDTCTLPLPRLLSIIPTFYNSLDRKTVSPDYPNHIP